MGKVSSTIELNTVIVADALEALKTLPSGQVQCAVTSPPYYGLRDYGKEGQLGLEQTPELYTESVVKVFREVRRVLRDDGTLWLNMGDSYNAAGRKGHGTRIGYKQGTNRASAAGQDTNRPTAPDLKPKDLVGIPWRIAFALQADGWYLRSDIIWQKPNPMPESVKDRPTKAHEYIFLFSKSEKYFYDKEAIKEPAVMKPQRKGTKYLRSTPGPGSPDGKRNRRSVWTVATKPYKAAHFAVFPTALIEPCVLAGTSAKGCCSICYAPYRRDAKKDADKWSTTCQCENTKTVPCLVLDPFMGSGTTAVVAKENGRDWLGIELNEDYAKLIKQRTANVSKRIFS